MSYLCHVLIHPTKSPSFATGPYTSGNVPKLPRCHRFGTAPGGANASGMKRLYIFREYHRKFHGNKWIHTSAPKNMEDYVPNWFSQVLKDVSSPERYEYLSYFTINSTPCLGGKMPDSTATSNAVRCLASCSSISAPWRTSSSATSLAP